MSFQVSMHKKGRGRKRSVNYHPSFSPGLRGVTLREGEEKLHPGWRKDRAACGRPSCFGVWGSRVCPVCMGLLTERVASVGPSLDEGRPHKMRSPAGSMGGLSHELYTNAHSMDKTTANSWRTYCQTYCWVADARLTVTICAGLLSTPMGQNE